MTISAVSSYPWLQDTRHDYLFSIRHVDTWPLVVDNRSLDTRRRRRIDSLRNNYGTAASPAVAERVGLDYFYFAQRQLIYLPTALLMLSASLMSPTGVFRIAIITLIIFTLLVVATFIMGTEIKGARRWISLASSHPAFRIPEARICSGSSLACIGAHRRY